MDVRPIIIYDQDCSLCVRFKQGLIHFSHLTEENFLPLQEDTIYEKFLSINVTLEKDECQKEVHMVDENNQVFRGSQVVEKLIPIVPAVTKLAWLLDEGSVKKASELFYTSVNLLKKKIIPGCRSCNAASAQ